MKFEELYRKAIRIKNAYSKSNSADGLGKWIASDYARGMVGDLGDLTKLLMAKDGLRHIEFVDEKIEHELMDLFWSLCTLYSELDINPEVSINHHLDKLAADPEVAPYLSN